ncbi:MAG: phosphotransferase [Bacteroidales bacterium]|nr:phosphotransferase [Bacteroidales bacterium]
MEQIPIIPGRGLLTPSALKARHGYLKDKGFDIDKLESYSVDIGEIQKNIESFIGTVEIPIAIVGPLLYRSDKGEELVYAVAGTLEGAMVASMNRGARAISLSGGFTASFNHQRMTRCPMFIFKYNAHCARFKVWVAENFELIKNVAESHSNHARLTNIETYIIKNSAHLKFIYTTGDASGQNMTTTCTWHAILWLVDTFREQTGISVERYIIEGNGASDKKVSDYNFHKGRGINVTAACMLSEQHINQVLRTSSDDIMAYFGYAKEIARIDGMHGFNVNIANAIAALFVATGQDLGSVHESAVGMLEMQKTGKGLLVSLNLPSLVVGTVGGGTHIAKQKQALELMGCYGQGKIERFASLIAGFALSLEISTYSAIVSGAFAKAHEKLGRNKPVNWLLKSEITPGFLERCLIKPAGTTLYNIEIEKSSLAENGIITEISSKTCNKLIGFIPVKVWYKTDSGVFSEEIVVKSKALDIDTIKGLHALAATIDTGLADLLSKYKDCLEYRNCHIKELNIMEQLHGSGFYCFPQYKGKCIEPSREIYLLLEENLQPSGLTHINTQKKPEIWTKGQIESVIQSIAGIHKYFQQSEIQLKLPEVAEFKPWEAHALYYKFISIMVNECADSNERKQIEQLYGFLDGLKKEHESLGLPKTIIHNDFNSRNIAIRKSLGTQHIKPCIYDWELAVINFPHRDIVEFLSFVLVENFSADDFLYYLHFHFKLFAKAEGFNYEQWKNGYIYSLKELLVTRVTYYEVAGILARYAFSGRVMKNVFRMLEILGSTCR